MKHYFAIETDDSHLEHHGRKGMKWHQHIFSKDRGSGGSSFTKSSDGTYSVMDGKRPIVLGASNPLEAAVWEGKRVGDKIRDAVGDEKYYRNHKDNLNHASTPFRTQADLDRHEAAKEKRSKMTGKEAERDLDDMAKCLSDNKMSEKSEDEQLRELDTSREFRANVWSPQDGFARNPKLIDPADKYIQVSGKPESDRKGPREEFAKACLDEMGYPKSFSHDPRILEKYSKQLIEATPSEYYVKHSEPFNGVNFRIV